MTILYKLENTTFSSGNADFSASRKSILCKISVKNIIAFCNLQEPQNNGFRSLVQVFDLVTPWDKFKVTSTKHKVCVLEWNSTGELLLLGYAGGKVEIWTPNHQLDNWTLLHQASMNGEDIINAKFFHPGKSLYFNGQKKELYIYTDKFERGEYRATVAGFGGTPLEGCVLITASGLLGAAILPRLVGGAAAAAGNATADNSAVVASNTKVNELVLATRSIALSRCFVTVCCMSYCPTGSINIAMSSDSRAGLVQAFKISLRVEKEDSLAINCESLPSVFLSSGNDYRTPKRISHLRLTHLGSDDVLYVAYECEAVSTLEQWNFIKKPQAVHKLLQKNKGDFVLTECWENTGKYSLPAIIADMCLPKLLSDNNQIHLILSDNSVQVLEPGLKKLLNSINVLEQLNMDERKAGCRLVSMDISQMNQILFACDNLGQMYALPTNQALSANNNANSLMDKNFKMSALSLQVSLLEYCILTGIDASDILLLNLSNLDLLIEKLTDNFMRQNGNTKQFYYSNFLSLKSNMCRIQSKQQDFDNLIILHSISITFKSLLRPSDLSSPDKGNSPADSLSIILGDPITDVDKVLMHLDPKDFTVEPLTLQSLQQLIQWVADLALSILHKLPDEVMKSKLSPKKMGYDISRDIVALGIIRELLVMIRIWGLLNSQCLPVYTKSVENVDILSSLFRLLTRLSQNSSEPDEVLLDECSVLSTQLLVPPRHFNTATSLLTHNNLPCLKAYPLIFSTQASEMLNLQDTQQQEVVFASGTKDGVSNLQLGCRAVPIRKCVRCGFVNSLQQKVAKTSALKAWCNRWLFCHCGGFWKTVAN